MKCDKYIQLLEKFEDSDISADEMQALNIHMDGCSECKEKYLSIEQLKKTISYLRQVKPVLKNRENLIDNIMDQIPEKETSGNNSENKNFFLLSYKIRIAITSMAASLILFFIAQQTYDAYSIKQLENKFSYQKKSVNYSMVKAGFIINILNKKNTYHLTGLFAKARKSFIHETFAMLNKEYSLVSKNESKKIKDSGFAFYSDSTNHP